MNERLRSRLERALGQPAGHPGKARAAKPSLSRAAEELFRRALAIARMELGGVTVDRDSLETASLALHLPFGNPRAMKPSSMGVFSISDRCGQSAELLISLGEDDDATERATRLLGECPRRATPLSEARVLSDALNLEDFGIAGLCRAAAMIVQPGGSLAGLADAFHKREQYGYWDARLKDGFHFASTRDIARSRLESARAGIKLLLGELQEELP